jgi:hypothetical protein
VNQEPGEDAVPGTIENPVMSCAVCGTEHRAEVMSTTQALAAPSDASDIPTAAGHMSENGPSSSPLTERLVMDLRGMSDEELEQLPEQLNQQLGELYNPS